MDIPTGDLRRFLQQRLNDSELTNFCFDYFPQVQREFGDGMARGQKIQLLLEYCRRHGQLPHLLRNLERERPQQVQAQLAHLLSSTPAAQPQLSTPIQNNPRQIFISYARADDAFAERLAKDLRQAGWPVWIAPDSIRPGEKFDEAIDRGLLECGIFLLLLTPVAVASKWVRDETNAALRRHRQNQMRFLPLLLKPCAELPPLWSGYQQISFTGDYGAGWQEMYHWLDPTAVVPLPSSTPKPPPGQEPQREAVQRHAARLYEQLQVAVAAEDWAEVVHLGCQIQSVAGEYRDVRRLVGVARGKLQIPRTQPKAEPIRPTTAPMKKPPAVTSRRWSLWLVGVVGAIVVVWIISNKIGGSVSPPTSVPTEQSTKIGNSASLPTLVPTLQPTKTPSEDVSELGTVCDEQGCNGEERRREKDGATVVYVPAGTFTMGSNANDANVGDDELPQHDVTLDGFWIDQHEVTNDQYVRCVNDGNCDTSRYADDATFNGTDYPVVGVSWNDAVDYCNWAGSRLPTEAEWEYAARGKDGRLFPWDNDGVSCSLANYGGCIGMTTVVGRYSKGVSWVNAFDMAGNVWEWVQDWYDENYYENSPRENPPGPETGTIKVLRGGSWSNLEQYVRAANRGFNSPALSLNSVGFRCAQE